ncbi:MAG: TIGR00730 family Rossman fold protein [Kofleriaceae bacterium]
MKSEIRAVTVFLSSSAGLPPYVAAVEELAREMARRDQTLVYGGAHRGLMGVLADAMIAAKGRTIGVIPQALVDLEIAHTGLTELHVVTTMHERKAMMFSLADAFVVAPGGFGTLEEAFEQITGLQLGYHTKPIVFLDVEGFWAPMADFLDRAVAANVLYGANRPLFRTAPTPAAALDVLAAW